jgi:ribosomal protein S28E/S33
MEPDTDKSFLDAIRYSYDYDSILKPPFKVGDIVRLKSGEAPQKVLDVKGYCIRCEYISSRKQIGFRSAADFVKYEYDVPSEEDKMEDYDMKDKLFKTLETNRFGTGLAIDSDGKYVLKMQDNGNFEAFSESELKRVMPYTFDVEFLSGSTNRANRYSYRGREGSVQLGDLLILEDSANIARVVAVNTESESATKTFKGRKLQSVELS